MHQLLHVFSMQKWIVAVKTKHQKLTIADLQKQTGCSPEDPTDCYGKPLCASAEHWAQEQR